MPMDSIIVQVNGESRQVPRETSVANLLADLGLAAGPVAVEINLQLVPRAQHARQSLAEGDKIEIVTLVGGG
jgi:sulfur carrier protein